MLYLNVLFYKFITHLVYALIQNFLAKQGAFDLELSMLVDLNESDGETVETLGNF